jgi:hypothetical protein
MNNTKLLQEILDDDIKLNFLVDQYKSIKNVSKLRLAADLIVKGKKGH